jgi:hypothetical protein
MFHQCALWCVAIVVVVAVVVVVAEAEAEEVVVVVVVVVEAEAEAEAAIALSAQQALQPAAADKDAGRLKMSLIFLTYPRGTFTGARDTGRTRPWNWGLTFAC